MTDTRHLELCYGHLGIPDYDTRSRQWQFPRQITDGPRLTPLGTAKVVIPRATPFPFQEDVGHSSRPHTIATDSGGAREILKSARVSSQDLSSHHQGPYLPIGDLFVHTQGIDRTRLGHSVRIPLLVTVAGCNGDLLRLSLLSEEDVEVETGTDATFRQSTCHRSEVGWWSAGGCLIQQLCSSKDDEDEVCAFLAVRCLSGISFFIPTLQPWKAAPTDISQSSFSLEASRLHANRIVHIRWQDACRAPFADIVFSPWERARFATIDESGEWLVWDLYSPRPDKVIWKARILASGKLQSDATDGWTRITWAGDAQILVVANRKKLMLEDLNDSANRSDFSTKTLSDAEECLLDIACLFDRPEHLFILTTAKLSVVHIVRGQDVSAQVQAIRIEVLLSWIHYRDPHDLSLHLSLSEAPLNDSQTHVDLALVTSRLTGLTTVYTFKTENSGARCISQVDPYNLEVMFEPTESSAPQLTKQLFSFTIRCRPLSLKRDINRQETVETREQSPNGSSLIQVTVLLADYSYIEGMYLFSLDDTPFDIAEPRISRVPRPPIASLDAQDDFVDEGNSENSYAYWQASLEVVEQIPSAGMLELGSFTHDRRTLNLEKMVKRMDREGLSKLNYTSTEESPISAITDSMQSALDDAYAREGTRCLTFYEIVDEHVIFTNRNKTNSEIEKIFGNMHLLYHGPSSASPGNMSRPAVVRRIDIKPSTLPGQSQDVLGMDEIDKALLEIFPQPPLEGSRKHGSLSEIARKVALRTYLSTFVSTPPRKNETEDGEPSSSHLSQESTRSSASSGISQSIGRPISSRSHSSPSSSRPLPTRLDSQPSSSFSIDGISRTENLEGIGPAEDQASRRLSSITSLTPQPSLPFNLLTMLGTWRVGADPDSVDWTAATQRLLSTDDAETDIETEDSQGRKKRRRRKEKEKKMQREQRLKESVEDWSDDRPLRTKAMSASQPLPFRVSGSQPSQGGSQVTETQTSDGAPVVSTQPEAGKHGGRPREKAGTRKKRPGF